MKYRCQLIFLLYIISFNLTAQSTNWYFGENAGLKFEGGSIEVITDGAINTNEACSTISTKDGELLFYTDGITVWNKNHQQMENGNGLYGHPSSTQSGVIVLTPGSDHLYYIFTIAEKNDPYGLRYSLVDVNANNGLGEVIQKNALIVDNTYEKIAAIKHCNNSDIWIIVHDWNSNDFKSFLVSASGIATTPIISSVGTVHSGVVGNRPGYMKSSAQGDKIALAINGPLNTIEIFDFNNSLGSLSNPIAISSGEYGYAYGVEFSPIIYVGLRDQLFLFKKMKFQNLI